jgi:peptide/nickel transport system substrate-binding protein
MSFRLNQFHKISLSWIWPLMIAFLLGVIIVGCGEKRDPSIVVIAVEELPNGLNPVLDINDEGRLAVGIIYQGLFDPSGEKPNDFKPALAKEITQNASDRAVFDISLQSGVTWHDGRDFNADDVLFSYACYTYPDNNSPFRGRIGSMIKNIEKVDSNLVRVTFVMPVSPIDVPFLLSFKIIPSLYQNAPLDTNLWNQTGLAFNRQPIGTGAYKFEGWDSNKLMLKRASPTARIEGITMQSQRDIDIRVKKLSDGQVDLVFNVDPSLFEVLIKEQLEYAEYVPFAYYAIAYNVTDSLLSDVHLRHAMAFATNKKALLREAYGTDNDNYINYGSFPHNAHKLYRIFEDRFAYNLDSSKMELQKSQYHAEPLTLIYPEEYGSIGEKIAYGYKHMMDNIGVQVDVTERGLDFYSKLDGKTYQMAVVYDNDFDRHYNILPVYLSEGKENITGIRDKQLDSLLVEWNNEIIMTKKVPIAKAVHERISEICPYAYLFTPPQRVYYSKRLRNVAIVDANSLLATVQKWEILLNE